MIPVLEAVPNFSEGRDPGFLREVTVEMTRAGAEVLDASSDPDHHRSVVTLIGGVGEIEDALVAGAEVALRAVDLRRHRGVHPRIGALDVAPVVPLAGTGMEVARASAHRVAVRVAALGIPVYLYAGSTPEHRSLADLRRGGFESLVDGFPTGRSPDFDAGRTSAHPTAGVTCVGARPLLLAWNLQVEGISFDALSMVARELRESGGGLPGVRALALRLERAGTLQLSMNLEEVERRDPDAVFERASTDVAARGGRIVATEVIGLIPDALVLRTGARRLRLLGADSQRLLSTRLVSHLARRGSGDLDTLVNWARAASAGAPPEVLAAAERLHSSSHIPPPPVDQA
ncbi:MAG: glutamate formiminotransferase [Gemmatimonadetes bacterium]|nr:glutamate formiminotransferase [Gemmatimonadota bacterium]NNK61663.1 glutamate formiminotransferase [Gemmatimonadota bacterium]